MNKLVSAVKYEIGKCKAKDRSWMSHRVLNYLKEGHNSEITCGIAIDIEDKKVTYYGKKAKELKQYSIQDPFKDGITCIIVITFIDVINGEAYIVLNGQLIGEVFKHPGFKAGFNYLKKCLYR